VYHLSTTWSDEMARVNIVPGVVPPPPPVTCEIAATLRELRLLRFALHNLSEFAAKGYGCTTTEINDLYLSLAPWTL
jgi:hypothetical protein